MRLQTSSIFIDQLRLHAYHGVMEQERRVGADFLVTLRVHYYIIKAMESDDVSDTVNYAELYELVKEEMAQPSNLLEQVAGRISRRIFQRFPQATAVDLRMTKLNPPMGADCQGAGVELHIENDRVTT